MALWRIWTNRSPTNNRPRKTKSNTSSNITAMPHHQQQTHHGSSYLPGILLNRSTQTYLPHITPFGPKSHSRSSSRDLASLELLLPVLDTILYHLSLIAPTTSLYISKHSYEITIPTLYRNVTVNDNLFYGLRVSRQGYRRTTRAFSYTTALRFTTPSSILHLQLITNTYIVPQSPHRPFPDLQRIELAWHVPRYTRGAAVGVARTGEGVQRALEALLQHGEFAGELVFNLTGAEVDVMRETQDYLVTYQPRVASIIITNHWRTPRLLPAPTWPGAQTLRIVLYTPAPNTTIQWFHPPETLRQCARITFLYMEAMMAQRDIARRLEPGAGGGAVVEGGLEFHLRGSTMARNMVMKRALQDRTGRGLEMWESVAGWCVFEELED
ncbi:hypothetical protein IAT38_002183 [Cryptococcus sp. DSM 104549]